MFVDWRLSHIEETFKMEDYEKNSLSQNDRMCVDRPFLYLLFVR